MHLLRVIVGHLEPSVFMPPGIVIGERKSSNFFQPSRSWSVRTNASRSARGRTSTARDFPESRQRKVLSPEGPPTVDRAAVGAEELGEFPDSSRRGTLPHGGDQDDDGAKINFSAEKTDRPRSHPLAASVALETEAMPPEVNGRQIFGSTPRLSEVVSPVQLPTARAGVLASSLAKVLIDIGQKQPETSIANQIMVPRGVLRGPSKNHRSTPLKDRDQVIRLFEGTFFEYLEEVDQKTRISPRLLWPRSVQTCCKDRPKAKS
jgi:hypothetical protein